jgi:hypothetical protein
LLLVQAAQQKLELMVQLSIRVIFGLQANGALALMNFLSRHWLPPSLEDKKTSLPGFMETHKRFLDTHINNGQHSETHPTSQPSSMPMTRDASCAKIILFFGRQTAIPAERARSDNP